MITLKDFMQACDYRITEGSSYGWQCFGYNAYCLDSWNGEQDGHTLSIVFDTKDQTVYQVTAYDYANSRAYRMTNPDFKSAFDAECQDRDVLDMAWEQDDGTPVEYTDLEVIEDWLEKATAIANDQDYDIRVKVPLNLPDDVLFELMKQAHEQDVTLNQMVEELLQVAIDQHKDDLRTEYDFSQGVRGPVAAMKAKKKKKDKK